MPNPDKPEPPAPPKRDRAQPDPDHPRLRRAPDDEAHLAEGETELIFISRRPRPGSEE